MGGSYRRFHRAGRVHGCRGLAYGNHLAGIVELPRDPVTGKRRRKWVYGDKEAEVRIAMRDVVAEDKRKQQSGDDRERFEAYLERWLADSIEPNARPSTYASYDAVVRRHLIPGIGKLRVRDVTAAAVKAFYARMRASGAEPLTRDQVRALLKAARGDRLEALYVLALTTGARQGELFALRWGDVDGSMISIRRSLQDSDGKGGILSGTTKTKASRRRFELPQLAVDALDRHRKQLQSEGLPVGERALVFPSTNGEPLRRQNFLRRDFYPLLVRAELPKIHFHDLRHTAATQLATAGVPVVQVAQLLGHVDPTITLRTYQHAFEGAAGDAAKQLGEIFAAAPKKRKRRA